MCTADARSVCDSSILVYRRIVCLEQSIYTHSYLYHSYMHCSYPDSIRLTSSLYIDFLFPGYGL